MPKAFQSFLACVLAMLSLTLAAIGENPPKAWKPDSPAVFDAAQKTHPKLYALSQKSSAELFAMETRDYLVPDKRRRDEIAAWHKSPRDPKDTSLIIAALREAHGKTPPDWPVVSLALTASCQGVDDTVVLDIASDLVNNAARLPDEAMIAVAAALPILALSGRDEDFKLLTKASSREFLGVRTAPGATDFVGGHRELLCQGVLRTISFDLPLSKAISALKKIRDAHSVDAKGFDAFIRGSANGLLQQLKSVQKGQAVRMPVPD